MRNWFLSNYENPLTCCPWDSEDKDWASGWREKCKDTGDILRNQFCGYYPDKVIEELIDELNEESFEWYPDEDDKYTSKEPKQIFDNHIDQIKQLLKQNIDNKLESTFFKMIFVSIITGMEVYLKDTFLTKLFENKKHIDEFIIKNKEINKKKYTLWDVNKHSDFVEEEIKKILSSIMWHKLKLVHNLYNEAFGIKIPLNKELLDAVDSRHIIVHRNGLDENNKELKMSKEVVENLIKNVSDFVNNIESDFVNNIENLLI